MPKTRKHKSRKQKIINMVGCSKKHKHAKSCKNKKSLGNCSKCGPNCHCGPNCNCPHPCPGSCYLNRRNRRQKGGSGCGPCGCPIGGLTAKQMNQFGGSPVLIDGTNNNTNNYIPIPGVGQNGGSGINPIPGPFTGSPWTANELPTQSGIGGDNNYLSSISNVITNDPQTQMLMSNAGYNNKSSMVGGIKRMAVGGYRYNKKKRHISSASKTKSIKGGGLIPQDLVNLGRSFTFNLNSAYNSLGGYTAPVNPLPYKDQLTAANNKIII
jgi:hypothetical protein